MLRHPIARTFIGATLASLALAACTDGLGAVYTASQAIPLPAPDLPGTRSPGPASGPARPGPATVPVVIGGVKRPSLPGASLPTRPDGPIVVTPGLPPVAGGNTAPRPGGPATAPGGSPALPGDAPTSPGGSPVPVAPSAAPAAGTGSTAGVAALEPLAIVAVQASGANPGYEAMRAVDGDPATEWGAATTGTAPTLTLSFNRQAVISAVTLKTGPTPTGASYAIETSLDGTTWWPAATATNAGWGLEDKPLAGTAESRHVRVRYVVGTSGKPAFAVFEVAILAAPAGLAGPGTAAGAPGAAIVVDPDRALHRATSHVLATNRNHVPSDFPNGAAKLAKLRELQPKWGGGKYLYRVGHGPTDGRHDYAYMTGYHFEQSWDKQAPYPYDDLRNALAEAATLGADQMHVINYGTGTPEEAGRYVSFLNRADDANRQAHPFAKQDVRLFELGNEIPWSMVRGHAEHAATDAAYAARAKHFAERMRASSDVPIQIGAVASINSNWEGNGWSGGAKTVKTILTTMGDQVDFLIYHGYPSWPLQKAGDLWTVMAQNEWNRQKLEKEIKPAIRQYAGGRDVWIANTEFFTHLYNDPTRARGMFGALYAADSIILAMNQDIRAAVQFCFDHKELADASFFLANDPARPTAIFKFQALLAAHWGDTIVATAGQELPIQRVTGASTSLDVPKLAFTAAAGAGKVWVMVVNRAPDTDVTARLELGFVPAGAQAWELAGAGGWDAANGEVKPITAPSLGGYTFPRASITLFELTR